MKPNKSSKKVLTVNASYKVVHWVMFLLVLLNLFLIFRFERDRRPVIVRETVTTVSNHVYVVTNVLRGVSSDVETSVQVGPTNDIGRIRVNDPSYEIPLSYHMYRSGSRYYVQIGNFQFGVGDMTSYGRIKSIFPERVLLDNGYSIKNERFEERFGYTEQSLRLRREYFAQFSVSNASHVVPVSLNPGEWLLPSTKD